MLIKPIILGLCTGAHFTGELSTIYITRAAFILRYWFLDETTKMNPNLDYSDTYPGTGVGVGGTVNAARIHIALGACHFMPVVICSTSS